MYCSSAGLTKMKRLTVSATHFPSSTAIYANANSLRYADTTTTASKPKAGGWNSPNPASWSGHTPAGRTYTTTPTQYAA
jgi:hypothetical protein